MTSALRVCDLLDDHVVLDLECLDRLYLNAYVPNLQVSGQVIRFMRDHLGCKIPSPAIMTKIGDRFRAAVTAFAESEGIPVLRFKGDDRQIDMVRPYWRRATGPGVVAIGVAQEFQRVFAAYQKPTRDPTVRMFRFDKADRRVTVYYFYVLDDDFGPGFIKICSYFPYPAKVWVNGHEWAKRQAAAQGLGFTELANGFAGCDDAGRLQAICDRLGAAAIQAFFERWMRAIPTPLDLADRAGGYWWELSMRQVEMSRTVVFDAPRRARAFFEAVVADNIDLGRPDEIKVIFGRQIRSNTKSEFATKVVTRGTEVTVNAFYKHSRIKEYFIIWIGRRESHAGEGVLRGGHVADVSRSARLALSVAGRRWCPGGVARGARRFGRGGGCCRLGGGGCRRARSRGVVAGSRALPVARRAA